MTEPSVWDDFEPSSESLHEIETILPYIWRNEPPYERVLTTLARALDAARNEALEAAANIADGGADIAAAGPELQFVPARKYASDLARDIADGIRALRSKVEK